MLKCVFINLRPSHFSSAQIMFAGGIFCLVHRALADLGGVPVHAPSTGPNSFVFTHIFNKKCPHWGSMPPQWVHAPPTGNPGSANAGYVQIKTTFLFSNTKFKSGIDCVSLFCKTSSYKNKIPWLLHEYNKCT